MSIDITKATEGAETFTNATNNRSKIFKVTTPDLLKRKIPDGALLVMKLRDSNGDEIPADSEIVIGAKPPLNEYPDKVYKRPYTAWYDLKKGEQYDNTLNQDLRIETPGPGKRIVLEEGYSLNIDVISDTQVDMSQSDIMIKGVSEGNM